MAQTTFQCTKQAPVVNGVVQVGDHVRELPALHHLQPCACSLCRPDQAVWQVWDIGEREGTTYLLLDAWYECPAAEVEQVF